MHEYHKIRNYRKLEASVLMSLVAIYPWEVKILSPQFWECQKIYDLRLFSYACAAYN